MNDQTHTVPATDAIISRSVNLPSSVWDRLTEDLKGLDRGAWEDPDLPETPLSDRIDMFLQSEIADWHRRIADPWYGDDLNDDVPF